MYRTLNTLHPSGTDVRLSTLGSSSWTKNTSTTTTFILFYCCDYLFIYLFIHLFISDKGPKSATDMPIKQCLTRYKIRQINTKNKRFKNRQTAKMPRSAGRQFHGSTTLSAKTFTHINTAQWLDRSLYAWPVVLWLLLANVKKSPAWKKKRKSLLHVGKTNDDNNKITIIAQ